MIEFILKHKWWVIGATASLVLLCFLLCSGVFCGGVLLWKGTEQTRIENIAQRTIEEAENVKLKGVYLAKKSDYEWSGYYDTQDSKRGDVSVTGGSIVRWTRIKDARSP